MDTMTASCVSRLHSRLPASCQNCTEHPGGLAPPTPPPPLQADRVAPQCGAIFRASVWAPQPGTAQWGPRLGGLDPGPLFGTRSRPTFVGQDATQEQHSS